MKYALFYIASAACFNPTDAVKVLCAMETPVVGRSRSYLAKGFQYTLGEKTPNIVAIKPTNLLSVAIPPFE